MAKFINAKFDLEKKVTFSCVRMVFLLIVSFSIGVLFGVELFLMKNQDFLITQPQVLVTPEPAVTPALTPTATPVSNNIEDWQAYRNEEYGFEFNYPSNWQVEDVVKGSFNSADDADSLLMLAAYGNNKFADSVWIETRKAKNIGEAINYYINYYCVQGGEVSKEEKIMFGVTEGKFVYFNSFCSSRIANPWVFIAHDAKVFVFEAPLGLTLDNKFHSIILSTFKFLN